MGSIPGPIVRFRFDAPSAQQAGKQLSDSVSNAMSRASKSTAQQFVSDWQAAAAKLRSQMTAEKLGLNSIAQAREKIISLAERETSVLQRKNQLTKSEYSLLKSATLEIEKQKNALEGFGAVTSPTRKIIQQMISGIGVRAGSYGGGMGSFAGVRINESLGKLADEATGGKLALLGVAGAIAAVSIAAIDMAKKGADLAVEMRNASEAAGISVKSMVELRSAAATLGVDSDVTVKMFRKFSQEITYAMGASLPHASIEAKRAAEMFQILGINVQKAAADPMEGLRELSQALSLLPDGAVKSATEVTLLGRGGQEAAPLINHLSEAIAATKDSSDSLAKNIGSAATAGDQLAVATTNLSNKWKELEVNLATLLIPTLSTVIGMVNKGFSKGGGVAGVASAAPEVAIPMMLFRMMFGGKSSGGTTANTSTLRNLISAPGSLSSTAATAALAQAAMGVSLGSKPGSLQHVDVLKQLAGAIVSDSTGTGRGKGLDTALPLYLKNAEKEYQEYEKSQEELLKKFQEHMKEVVAGNDKTFNNLLAQTGVLGAMGIGLYSPDKTGAGANDLMQSMEQKAIDAAQKIRDANVQAAQDIIDKWNQWRDEGKSLFETLLSGGRNFAKEFERQIENIALKPVQNAFGNMIGNVLYGLDKLIPDSIGGSGTAKTGTQGKSSGGWLSKLGQAMKGIIGPPKSVQNAQQTIQNAQITAQNVYINGAPLGTQTTLPKPASFMDFLGGNTSFTSPTGSGGMSIALAAAGGTALAGSGGSPVATGGGVASLGGGVPSVSDILGNTGTARGGVGGALLQTLGSAIPGGALLGAGLMARGGSSRSPQAIAMGAGAMAQGALSTLGKLFGGGNTATIGDLAKGLGGVSVFDSSHTTSTASDFGDWLGIAGQVGGGIGSIIAGSQVKGLGGVLQGALGGAQVGTAILPGIGTGIGAAIGGLISGIFGGGSAATHAKEWQQNVTNAMNNQRVTLPPSETFAFASGNTMAQTLSTTFGAGPGGRYTNSTLAANTPFWANAVYGTPRNAQAQIQWNAMINGLNPNSPFYGGGGNNPFNGAPLPGGMNSTGYGNRGSGSAGVYATGAFSPNSGVAYGGGATPMQVHFNFPGMIDEKSAGNLLSKNSKVLNSIISRSVFQQSSGTRQAMVRAYNLA